MPEDNIQQTGPLTGPKLRKLNDDNQLGLTPDYAAPFNPINPGRDASRDVYSPLYDGQGDYWGRSRFDRRNPFLEDEEFQNVSDLRAEEQSGFNKLLNGTIKMLSTAGTTFLDNTVGFVWGLGQGLANIADDNPDTNFWRGLWDNDFNKAMMSAQDAMEKIAPNYYTQKELNNPWYKNLWTANFWGDKFLKNMGFTMGSLAAMAVPGVGAVGDIAGTGVNTLLKSVTYAKALKGSKFARSIFKGADRAGALTQKLINTAISAHGEAAIESINAVKRNKDNFAMNLENWKNDKVREARSWYEAHSDEYGAYEKYLDMLGTIDEGFAKANEENDNTVKALGNSVYGMNMLLLGITNNIEFGKYIKGGYNQSKNISNFKLLVDGVQTADQKAAGRAFARGQAVKFVADERAAHIGAKDIPGIIGGTLGRNLTEGFEEGAQNLISDSGQMQAQAKINVATRNWSKEHKNSLFAQSLNPGVTDDLVNRSKAFMNAWRENFGTIGSPGWEEVFLGALTGGVGTLGFRIDNKTGKVIPAWQGGFMDEIRDRQQKYGEQEAYVKTLNNTLLSDDFRKRSAHAITAMALADGMEVDLINGDILNYKNKELMQIANDALAARDNGGLEMYRSFYEELARNITDKDIDEVKASFRDPVSGKSYFDGVSNEDIKQEMRDKAKSTLDKIDSVLESYNWHLRNYGGKFEIVAPVPGMSDYILNEVVTLDALQKDLQRRKKDLESQAARLDETDAEQAKEKESISKDIEQIDKSMASIKETYDDYIKHPDHVVRDFTKLSTEAYAHQLRKDADTIKSAFESANTIQDVANIYYNSNVEKRNDLLEEVRKNASPEKQQIIDSFKDYLATTNALPTIVNQRMAELREQGINPSAGYQNGLSQLLNNVVSRIVNDPNVNYSNPKNLVSDAIKKEAKSLREGTDGYTKTEASEPYNNFFADELDDIANRLNAYNIVYQAAKAGQKTAQEPQAAPKTEPQTPPQQPAQGASGTNQPVQTPPPPATSETADTKQGSEVKTQESTENLNSKSGYTYYPLFTNTNDSTDGRLAEIKDSTDVKRRRGQIKQWADSAKDGADFLVKVHASGLKFNGHDELGGQVLKALDAYKSGKISEKEFLDLFTPEQFRNQPQAPVQQKPEGGVQPSAQSAEQEGNAPEEALTSSLQGNSYQRYSIDNHIAKEYRNSASDWFKSTWADLAMGYHIEDIQDNYLWKMLQLDSFKGKDGVGRIPVRYVKFNNHLFTRDGKDVGMNRYVFLATEYTDAVKNVFPEEMRSKFRLLEYDGKQYLVIGTLKAYTESDSSNKTEMTPLEQMFERIESAATAQLNERDETYTVLDAGENGEYTNYIYQVNNGEVITGYSGKERTYPALNELLSNPATNPRGLGLSDLVFDIVMGSENGEGLYLTTIGKNADKYSLRPFTPTFAGQVYVYLPDSTGSWIPWGVNPLSFSDIMSMPDNKVKSDIQELVHNLAEALSESNPQGEKLKEINTLLGELRGTLLFGSPDIGGSNFKYDEPQEQDVGDGMTVPVGHALKVFVGGAELFDFNLNANPSVDAIEGNLYKMLNAINPHMNIDATVLRNTPEYYFDNGILTTDAQVFGTVNAQSYLYSINADNTPDMEFKPVKSMPDVQSDSSLQRIWLDGKEYRKENGRYLNKNGKPVKKKELISMLDDVINLYPDSATFVLNKAPYWIIGDRAYVSSKDGRFTSVEKAVADDMYQKYLKQKSKERRKKQLEKENKEAEENPKMPEEKPKEGTNTPPVQKPAKPAGNQEKTAIFVDGFMKYASTPVSSENAQYLGTFANTSEYFEVLDKDRVDATTSDLLTLMVAEKTGENPLELSINQVMDAIWNSKYQQRLANAVESPTEGQESIKDVIDNIIKCGL